MPPVRRPPDVPPDDIEHGKRLGALVRSLRERRALSVRTLARESGLSPSFISQVEHGVASPSIASMERIAHALGVTMSEFFAVDERQAAGPFIVSAGEGRELTSAWSHAVVRELGPSRGAHLLQLVMLVLGAGGRSGARPAGHQGEEFAIVFAGQVLLRLEGAEHRLQAGDAVSLPSGMPHQWENLSDRDAHIVLVSLRPPGDDDLR